MTPSLPPSPAHPDAHISYLAQSRQIPARPLLNKRAKRLIGHQFKLENDIDLGEGKVQIGDTMWHVQCEGSLPEGTLVEVVGTERMQLVIAPKS